MSDKVFITGGAGFVGSLLVGELLNLGHRVSVLDSLRYQNGSSLLGHLGHKQFTLKVGDVRDTDLMLQMAAGADVVIPLAALVGEPVCSLYGDEETYAINLSPIRKLVAALAKGQRLIFPNTDSGYGSRPGVYCTEKDELQPITAYGISKKLAEECVLGHENAASLRLATVFGTSPRPRLDLMVNDFVHQLATAGSLAIFEPDFNRNFIHVRDLVRVFVMMTNYHYKGVYNVGDSAMNQSKLQLAKRICNVMGLDHTKRLTTMEGKDKDCRDYLISNTKLEASTGFRCHYGLKEGVAEVVNLLATSSPEERKRMKNTWRP